MNSAGKRSIEGLLPDSIRSAVYTANPDVVLAATSGTTEERKQATRVLKNKMLAEFKSRATPGHEYYAGLYAVAKLANRALQ